VARFVASRTVVDNAPSRTIQGDEVAVEGRS
jgi:hypothetical protein